MRENTHPDPDQPRASPFPWEGGREGERDKKRTAPANLQTGTVLNLAAWTDITPAPGGAPDQPRTRIIAQVFEKVKDIFRATGSKGNQGA